MAHCTLADRSQTGEEITYYTAKGIFLTAQAYGLLSWERPEAVPLRDRPALWSRTLKASIDRSFPRDAAPLVKALVTGNRDSLTDPFTTSLQRMSLIHIYTEKFSPEVSGAAVREEFCLGDDPVIGHVSRLDQASSLRCV